MRNRRPWIAASGRARLPALPDERRERDGSSSTMPAGNRQRSLDGNCRACAVNRVPASTGIGILRRRGRCAPREQQGQAIQDRRPSTPPRIGRLRICSSVTTCFTGADPVSMTVGRAVTSTANSTPPGFISMGTSRAWLTARTMLRTTTDAKPARLASSWYAPTGSKGKSKYRSVLVVVSVRAPVALCVATTT